MNPQDPSHEAPERYQQDRPSTPPPQRTKYDQPERSVSAPAEPASPAQPAPAVLQTLPTTPVQPDRQQQYQEPERPFYNPQAEQAPAAPVSPVQDQPQYAGQIPEAPVPAPHPHHVGVVTWTASEFVAHDKDPKWFMALAGGTVLVAGLIFLITRSLFSTVVVIIFGILFGIMANRQPRELHYGVDDHGIGIGNKTYPYGDFRSFSLQQDGPLKSITFMPLKRFMPPLSMYFDPADEDKVIEVLTAYLPMQDHPHDPLEQLMKRIRF